MTLPHKRVKSAGGGKQTPTTTSESEQGGAPEAMREPPEAYTSSTSTPETEAPIASTDSSPSMAMVGSIPCTVRQEGADLIITIRVQNPSDNATQTFGKARSRKGSTSKAAAAMSSPLPASPQEDTSGQKEPGGPVETPEKSPLSSSAPLKNAIRKKCKDHPWRRGFPSHNKATKNTP